jgi:hemerythrin-like metal-binding domain
MIEAGSQLSVIETLAFPVALYGPEGNLRAANMPFHDLMDALVADPAVLLDLRMLGESLGVSFTDEPPGGMVEVVGPDGHVASFTVMAGMMGGWTLSAQDITEQRRAERKAERSQKVAIIALADLAEHRDTDTGEHVLRVARLTHEIARHLHAQGRFREEMDEDFLRHVGTASILHDVGKVCVPDSVLLKPGLLTPEERALVQKHAQDGAAILRKAEALLTGSTQFRLAADIAACHHERWDGTGYPAGLAGPAIPLAARIVAVADVFDALISARPYKDAWPSQQALEHIRAHAGSHFDPVVVAALGAVLEARARAIEWSGAWEVGNAQIDHDHRILLALVNQVSSPETKGDPIAIEFVLDELLGYTAIHFAREEELMARAGYPGLEDHKAIHRAMIAEVGQLRNRLVAFTPRLGDDLHRFLGTWLMQHILVEDRQYVPFMTPTEGKDR